ncbi:hypothetical protein GALMADRAFT_137552 [Galerina marginata CBS 339.88]|uniref:Uncharacterized protein n=1 Tax=Galerina marginata (strain CBS 339.88) TaxID=685588 RepID=A0A067T5W2_GALM3|nr:hypothetical protein GALMADRAFT_137552 [Galerina marginata CBS 339.88]
MGHDGAGGMQQYGAGAAGALGLPGEWIPACGNDQITIVPHKQQQHGCCSFVQRQPPSPLLPFKTRGFPLLVGREGVQAKQQPIVATALVVSHQHAKRKRAARITASLAPFSRDPRAVA